MRPGDGRVAVVGPLPGSTIGALQYQAGGRLEDIMSTNDTQQTLVGTPTGDRISIDTSGRFIRPLLELPTILADEAKVHFGPDGLSLTAVDPANVGMVDLHAPAGAFDSYELQADGELTVRLNLSGLASDLQAARTGTATDDPVSLALDATTTRIEIAREYDGTALRSSEERLNIDPDSIREEPDLPELALPCETTVSPRAFRAAADHVARRSDHADLINDGDTLVMAGAGAEPSAAYSAATRFEDSTLDGEGEERSKFLMDYLNDMASALVAAKTDAVTVQFGDEMPTQLHFERTDADDRTLYAGTFILAPRVPDS
jgi:proliferating cell nuclear antigen